MQLFPGLACIHIQGQGLGVSEAAPIRIEAQEGTRDTPLRVRLRVRKSSLSPIFWAWIRREIEKRRAVGEYKWGRVSARGRDVPTLLSHRAEIDR